MVVSTPKKHPVFEFKQQVQSVVRITHLRGLWPTPYPVSVRAAFLMPRPKYLATQKSPRDRLWHTKRPDIENIAKALLDALTGIVWTDDSLVAELHLEKKWAALGEPTGVILTVESLPNS